MSPRSLMMSPYGMAIGPVVVTVWCSRDLGGFDEARRLPSVRSIFSRRYRNDCEPTTSWNCFGSTD